MRTTKLSLVALVALTTMTACSVEDVDTPALSGPSSLSRTIIMRADRDTLVQDGVSEAAISLSAVVQPGQSENVRLRAQVFVNDVAADIGTLSNKTPITPTTIFYRAPAAPAAGSPQVPTTITIRVTPDDQGDFRSEVTRQLDIRLIPQTIIQPINPNLTASFTFAPAAPQVLTVVSFNAAASQNNGVACGQLCTYTWDFGDGTSASGMQVTHQFRTVNTFPVRLTVTDNVGAQATVVQPVPVAAGTPPGTQFTVSPQNPGVNQDVFFNASQAAPAAGRTIVNYEWSFGDGEFGRGVVTTHRFAAPGQYQVQLVTTDDAGSIGRSTPTTVTVGPAVGPEPTADMTCSPASPKPNQPMSCNASASRPGSGANITEYRFDWGDGSPIEVHTNPVQSHVYTGPGTFTVTLEVRDSLGRVAFFQVEVTVAP